MNKTIDDLLKEFKTYKLDVEGKAENSINQYIRFIKSFCEDMNIKTYNELININSQKVRDWLSILATKENCSSSRNNKLTAVKQLFLFLEDEKLINVDRTISKIKFAKIPKKEVKYLSPEIIDDLIRKIKNLRVKTAVAITTSTGLRFSELIQITCTDIERGYKVVVGKGNKEREVWFNYACIKIAKKYIETERARIVKKTNVDTDLLFLSLNGNLMTRQSFTKSLKYYSRLIGLYWSEELSPHKLRHSYITKMLDEGTPIHIVRDIVGHSNMATTDRYSHTDKEAIKRAMLGETKK